jgi:hypothetical protein
MIRFKEEIEFKNKCFRSIKYENWLVRLLKNRKIYDSFTSFSYNYYSGGTKFWQQHGDIIIEFDLDKVLEQGGIETEYTPEFFEKYPDIAEYVLNYENKYEYAEEAGIEKDNEDEINDSWETLIESLKDEQEILVETQFKYEPGLILKVNFHNGKKPSPELKKLLNKYKIKYEIK